MRNIFDAILLRYILNDAKIEFFYARKNACCLCLVRYTLLEYVGANSIFISLQFANAPN